MAAGTSTCRSCARSWSRSRSYSASKASHHNCPRRSAQRACRGESAYQARLASAPRSGRRRDQSRPQQAAHAGLGSFASRGLPYTTASRPGRGTGKPHGSAIQAHQELRGRAIVGARCAKSRRVGRVRLAPQRRRTPVLHCTAGCDDDVPIGRKPYLGSARQG